MLRSVAWLPRVVARAYGGIANRQA